VYFLQRDLLGPLIKAVYFRYFPPIRKSSHLNLLSDFLPLVPERIMPNQAWLAVLFGLIQSSIVLAANTRAEEPATPQLASYGDAYRTAQTERRMLVIYFRPEAATRASRAFETQVLNSKDVTAKLAAQTFVQLPVSVTGVISGKPVRLLHQPGFAEMHRQPGVAIIDLAHRDTRHYGHVVSVYPFKGGRTLSRVHFLEMLSLPAGTLTQRTLIFAVRVHPEGPSSADGRLSSVLALESESHARHQAQIGVQGHHNWDYRFQRINAKLATGMTAQEVCAESWPGQDLIDAAFECVDSWRQSSGHWSAVRSRHNVFGYDMKRGRNGVWYGTGIFGRR
jgi:hypothetical protein